MKRLTPHTAPLSSWNAEIEIFELTQIMSEYIENREYLYRAMGVLPRYGGCSGHQPNSIRFNKYALSLPSTEVSMHILMSHPFGRDLHADPLGLHTTDKFSITTDEKLLTNQISQLPTAKQLRYALKNKVIGLERVSQKNIFYTKIIENLRKLNIILPLSIEKERKRSEFAREMMMLPISLKNPDVSLPGGVAAGASSTTGSGSSGSRGNKKKTGMSLEDGLEAQGVQDDTSSIGGSNSGGSSSMYENVLQRRFRRGPER